MKKIVNGKLYNTETAKEVAHFDNGLFPGDFGHYTETLFLKKTGEWFLYGKGGSLSIYGTAYANGWIGGEAIIPYTEKQAKNWAMAHISADEYISLFGDVEE